MGNLRTKIKMNKCKYCLTTENLTVDHKVPLIQGGSNEVKNLQCLCKRCNGLKSGLSQKQIRNLWQLMRLVDFERERRGKKPMGWKYFD